MTLNDVLCWGVGTVLSGFVICRFVRGILLVCFCVSGSVWVFLGLFFGVSAGGVVVETGDIWLSDDIIYAFMNTVTPSLPHHHHTTPVITLGQSLSVTSTQQLIHTTGEVDSHKQHLIPPYSSRNHPRAAQVGERGIIIIRHFISLEPAFWATLPLYSA